MIKKLSIVLGTMLALLPTASFAAERTISSIMTWNDGHVLITFVGVNSNACATVTSGTTTPSTNSQYSLGMPNDAKQKTMLQIAMLAFTTNKKVDVTTFSCSNNAAEPVQFLSIKQ